MNVKFAYIFASETIPVYINNNDSEISKVKSIFKDWLIEKTTFEPYNKSFVELFFRNRMPNVLVIHKPRLEISRIFVSERWEDI